MILDISKMDSVSIIGGDYAGRTGYLYAENEADASVYLVDEQRLISVDLNDLE